MNGCKTLSTYNLGENSELVKFSSSSGTFLNIQLYDNNKKTDSLPGFINVNGIYFDSNFNKFHHRLKVNPGVYNIEAFFISKEPLKLNGVNVQKNDSTIVKLFMKDNLTPIE
jgi:hypothetical protein